MGLALPISQTDPPGFTHQTTTVSLRCLRERLCLCTWVAQIRFVASLLLLGDSLDGDKAKQGCWSGKDTERGQDLTEILIPDLTLPEVFSSCYQ